MGQRCMLGGDPICEFCYVMHSTGQCLYICNDASMLKLLWFRQYLRCQKQALDKNGKSYMLARDYVPDNWDENSTLVVDGLLLLNEKVLAKY